MAFGFQIQLLKKLSHDASVPINEKKKINSKTNRKIVNLRKLTFIRRSFLFIFILSFAFTSVWNNQITNENIALIWVWLVSRRRNKWIKFLKKVWCNVSGGGEGRGHNEIIAFYQLTLKCKLVSVVTFLKLTFWAGRQGVRANGKGQTLETSALETLYDSQFIL